MSIEIDDKAAIVEGRKTLEDGHSLSLEQALPLISSTPENFEEEVKKLPNISTNDASAIRWLHYATQGIDHLMKGAVFQAALTNPEADWTNRPTHDGQPIGLQRLGRKSSGGNLSGENAVLKVKSLLGLGTIMHVPLWHTGCWISLKAPSNSSILELNRRIAEEKITLGRQTSGMVFSNTSVYIQSYLVNFILAHIYDTNLETRDPAELKRIILVNDLPTLIWGILCTMYPDGYDLREPCVAALTECTHVSEGKVNISRMRIVDRSRLHEDQLKHMANRNQKRTLEELEKYQELHTHTSRTETVNDDNLPTTLEVIIKCPTIDEYEQIGFNWISEIEEMVDKAFSLPAHGKQRDSYITEHGRINRLRQYSHWISEIRVGEGEHATIITDRQTIDTTCGELSQLEVGTNAILGGIGEFIEASAIAVIGYPNAPCPSCGLRYGDHVEKAKEKGGEDKIVLGTDVPEFVAIDLTTTFFTLTGQRLNPTLTKAL